MSEPIHTPPTAVRAATDNRSRFGSLIELTRLRFLEFIREPEAVFWVFIFPILLAGGLGVAFRSRPAEVTKIAVSTRLADAERFRALLDADSAIAAQLMNDSTATHALRTGEVALVVEPAASGPFALRYDRDRPEARLAQLLTERALDRVSGTPRPAVPSVHVSERGSRYIDFVLPGLLAMNLMGSSVWSIGFAIVDARRKKLLKRLVATPMKRSHYLMSALLMRIGLMTVETAVITLFGVLVFGVPMRGSLLVYGAAALLGTLAFGALGLLIASRAQTIEGASGMMNLVMLPMWVASGVFFAASNFPDVVQPFIQALPLTALVDAMRGAMLQGLGWSELKGEFLILLAWLVLPFFIALRIFRWR